MTEACYKILLYSENQMLITWLKNNIKSIMTTYNIDKYEVNTFNNATEVIKLVYKTKQKFNIYFLDISENDKYGIDLAILLRDLGDEDSIVFICNQFDSNSTGYKVKVLDYLIKPIQLDILERILYYDYRQNFKTNLIVLSKNSNYFHIDANNIVCIEVYKRGIKIYLSKRYELAILSRQNDLVEDINLEKKYIYYSEKISQFKKRLCLKKFIQCHQSFVINVKKIISIRRYTTILDNNTKSGVQVDISKNSWNMVKRVYLESHHWINETLLLEEDVLETIIAGNGTRLYQDIAKEDKNTKF